MKKAIRIFQRKTGPILYSFLLVILLLLNGCVTSKKTTLLSEQSVPKYEVDYSVDESYLVRAYDNLYIRVMTPDIRYAEMFNSFPVSSTTISATEQSVDLLSYAVSAEGNIELPYLGPIHVEGKTVTEIKSILEEELADYVTDVSIIIKLVNYHISLLGEVTNPGRYPLYQQKINIFEAIAMGGDVDDFGNRYKVQVIRTTSEGSVVSEFDLTDKSLVDSEFYWIRPNDVIYVEPMKGKFFGMSEFPYTVVLTTLSTTILLLSFIQN